MSPLQQAVVDYIEMRRRLGFKLHYANVALLNFVSFLDQQGTSQITIPLALEWAQQHPAARPVEWARRLSVVRGFARVLERDRRANRGPAVGIAASSTTSSATLRVQRRRSAAVDRRRTGLAAEGRRAGNVRLPLGPAVCHRLAH